ncbi:F-box only protein 28 isoform X1 [Meriones unguiculatus]|uniref:F-box only protein 28 isoform X1 n=1 Tax=Meriones unguiculatus TaxID=10047 RepID=UPI00293F37D6|nr:F-box only protein 28 isoform X1 [Meriones unguiculatus]
MAAASEDRMAEEGGGGHGDGGPGSAAGSAQRQPPPPPSQAPQPGSQAPGAPALAPDHLPQNNTLVALPIVAIENILSFMSYDEISQLRLVCKRMDLVCQRMLNQGFLKVERYHNLCQKQVKAQLPRYVLASPALDVHRDQGGLAWRESERRNHSLARHADILAAVETRLSLLNMTFMKYVDSNLCCFIPGKVIDEIYRVLRYVNSTRAPQRAHEVLQELRDISSMAMEYFDEKIVPILKRKLPGSDVSGRLMGSPPVPGPSAALTTMQLFSKQNPSRQEVTKLQQQVKTNGAGVTVLRREISELRTKVQEQQKQLQDQDQKLLEQTQIIGEQNARLAELERKLREVMESAVGTSSGSGQSEESPRKRRKATEAIDSLRKSKRLRNRK